MATSKTTAKTSAKTAAVAKAPVKAKASVSKKVAAPAPEVGTKVAAKTTKSAKTKADMLGLVAQTIQAAEAGADVSSATAAIPGLAAVVKTAKKAKATGAAMKIAAVKADKPTTIRNKGPRGFRVDSPAWLKSIADAKGIALSPANMPKLLDTAAVHNVELTPDLAQIEMVKMIAKAISAQPAVSA